MTQDAKQGRVEPLMMNAYLLRKTTALVPLACLAILVGSVTTQTADAQPNRRVVNGNLLNNTTYVYEYDSTGRLSLEQGVRYDPEGNVLSTTDRVYTRDRDGRVLETLWTRHDAREELLQRQSASYIYQDGRLAELHRTIVNYVSEEYRMEIVRFHVLHKGKGRVQETKVFGRDRELIEIRYLATDHNRAGKTTSRDYSVYDPQEVQIRRHLETFQYRRDGVMSERARIYFDENDEVVRSEQGVVHQDGRLDSTTAWTLLNRDEEVTGYRDVRVQLHPKNKRPFQVTTTLFDRGGDAIQRRIETTSFTESGQLIAKRASVEYFD